MIRSQIEPIVSYLFRESKGSDECVAVNKHAESYQDPSLTKVPSGQQWQADASLQQEPLLIS